MIRMILMMLGMIGTVEAAPHLDRKYTVAYGDPKASIHIVEYISFGCAPCVRSFAEEFDGIRRTYIETGQVYWVFHPHPVDLITVQGMACLERLNAAQKQLFFEAVFLELYHSPQANGVELMGAALDALKIPAPRLWERHVLQATPAFKAAFTYQQSPYGFTGTPTLSINGRVIDDFPTRALIDKLIKNEQGIPQ